jgi:hypothetical protein
VVERRERELEFPRVKPQIPHSIPPPLLHLQSLYLTFKAESIFLGTTTLLLE